MPINRSATEAPKRRRRRRNYIVVSPSLLRTTERRRKKLKCSNGMLNDANTVLGRCLLLVNNYILYIFIQKSSGSAGKYIARLCSLLVLRNVMVGNSFGKVIGMHCAAFRIVACCCCMMMENLRGMRIHLSRVCVCVLMRLPVECLEGHSTDDVIPNIMSIFFMVRRISVDITHQAKCY